MEMSVMLISWGPLFEYTARAKLEETPKDLLEAGEVDAMYVEAGRTRLNFGAAYPAGSSASRLACSRLTIGKRASASKAKK